MGPQPAHPGQVVFELSELDLELALRGVSVAGEDVEDDRRAVDHGHAERRLEVALLTRAQFVVGGYEVGVCRDDLGLQVLQLARPQVGVGMGTVAVLDRLPHCGHARGAQELTQL